jgi:hypothetical protein
MQKNKMNMQSNETDCQQSTEFSLLDIQKVEFDSLEGLNQAFEDMMSGTCCGSQGGHKCGCGPRF